MYWNIGGGIKHGSNLIQFNKQRKIYYDTNHNFYNAVYDSIFGLKWNGGRICLPKDSTTIEDFIEYIKIYNAMGIGFNFSFSNLLIEEEDLKDEYCNLLLSSAAVIQPIKKMNGVIVASSLLREYLNAIYPDLKIIYSVCNGLHTLDDYNRETNDKRNDLVVLHPDFNHNYDFIPKLENKDRIEVMVNDACAFGCPFRKKHYLDLSKYAKQQSSNPIVNKRIELDMKIAADNENCDATANGMIKDGRNILSYTDLKYMEQQGFQWFKIIGREFDDWNNFQQTYLNTNLEQYWIRNIVASNNKNWSV